MAQPTVTARPATWAGTSGPILYKFTSTNYSNAGYYMAVEIWNSTTAAKIADAKYYANSTGAVVVDVAPFLKSAMSLDNEADLTSGTVYTDVNWVKYYIKYREYWTASSESQVNDSVNIRYAIYGGLQLGSANDFTDYADAEFALLTQVSNLTYKDSITLLSFIISNSSHYFLRVNRYEGGVLLNTVDSSDFASDKVYLAKLKETGDADSMDVSIWGPVASEVLTNEDFATTVGTPWANTGSGVSWGAFTGSAEATLNSSGSATSKWYSQTITLPTPGIYRIKARCYTSDITKPFTLDVATWDGVTPTVELSFSCSWGSGSEVANEQDSGIITVTTATAIRFMATATGGAGAFDAVVKLISFENLNVDGRLSELRTIEINDPCSNTIVLQWRNSLGGVECFPFTYNQDYTWDYGNGKKAKRLTLYADNLTLSQWEAIQGLNTLGDLYRSPITEMTTSLNRTSATIGQSVYVLNPDGSKIGVNVIGQANTTQTKQKTHSAFVTIEYPELFLQ